MQVLAAYELVFRSAVIRRKSMYQQGCHSNEQMSGKKLVKKNGYVHILKGF